MDTPTASRSSRPPLWAALIALVAIVALAACSSSESNADDSESEPTANEAAATNDVVSSSGVSLTLEFDQASLEELLSNGYQVMVARAVQVDGGQEGRLMWLSFSPMEDNQVTYEPADISVFASISELVDGAQIEQLESVDVDAGSMAIWNNSQFEVQPLSADAVIVMSESESGEASVFGLAGPARVNGELTSAPYIAASLFQNEQAEFTDTGRLIIWVANSPVQPGTVINSPPANATTVDVASQPTATYRFDSQTQSFVPAS